MTRNEIIKLTDRITSGVATDDEIILYNRMLNSFQLSKEDEIPVEQMEEIGANIKASIKDRLSRKKAPIRMQFYKYAAAAAIFVLLGGAIFFLLNKKPGNEIASGTQSQTAIPPGKDGAVLTLANGKVIVLEDKINGKLTEQAIKKNNSLSYENASTAIVEYNTVSTPVGRQFSLVLADGSKVWLNAASSIRFPTAFSGNERTVELTGEGYFEVAHNAAKPFHVKMNDMDVQVLGTHFNIMGYGDEDAVRTTLLEGSVKVTKQAKTQMLQPGQQAVLNRNGDITLNRNADIEQAVAWKNGLIQFAGADMGTVMRQIGRWYDVDVQLQGNIQSVHISGKVSRNLNLSVVIKILEESGIDIKLEGRKIIATPKP
jgi:ferric-dicitrate binding protein FerR (iron transport regulator)